MELFGFKKKKVYNTSNNKFFLEEYSMICPNCKHENDEDARFCENCGTRLVQEEATATTINNKETEENQEKTEEKKEWYYVDQDQSVGPFTKTEMQGFIDQGILNDRSYVWKPGMADWIFLRESEFKEPGQTVIYRCGDENIYTTSENFEKTTLPQGIQTKSVFLCIFLMIITCGLYGIYWLYCIVRDVNALAGHQKKEILVDPFLVVILSIVTCGIYGLYTYWKIAKLIASLEYENYQTADDSMIVLIVAILGFPIISLGILQSSINGILTYAK